jgi:citrate lyase subunit beta/citryl-CoA lyase
MTAASLQVWRSLLFVPVTAKRFVDGAARRGADAIILDREDSVAESEKERARGSLLWTSGTSYVSANLSIMSPNTCPPSP